MSGTGKYNTYIQSGAPAQAKRAFLSKLYNIPPASVGGTYVPFLDLGVTNNADCALKVSKNGNDFLRAQNNPTGKGAGIQKGDADYFPDGVDFTYGTAPNTADVKWARPGDPSTPYTPDIASPTTGPGHIEGIDKSADPSSTQTRTVMYELGHPDGTAPADWTKNDNTKSPSVIGSSVFRSNTLGEALKKGTSVK